MEPSSQDDIVWKVLNVPISSELDQSYRNDINSVPTNTTSAGKTYRGYDRSDAEVTIEVIPKELLEKDKDQKVLFDDRMKVLSTVNLDQIVSLKHSIESKNNYYLISEAHTGLSLEELLKPKTKIDEKEALLIIKRVAEAFDLVEKMNLNEFGEEKFVMIHRNIKPKNIVYHEGRPKLRGFEFSKFITKETKLEILAGSLQYVPPQTLSFSSYTYKRDIWALGITIYRAIVGEFPWRGETRKELLQKIESYPLKVPKSVSKEMTELIGEMLKVKEEERIDWEGILKHPALKALDA